MNRKYHELINFNKILRSGAGASIISLYASVAFQYLLHLYAAKIYQTGQYGHIVLALTLAAICGVLMQLGFSNAVVKFIGVYDTKNQLGLLHGVVRGAGFFSCLGALTFSLISVAIIYAIPVKDTQYQHALAAGFITIAPLTVLLFLQNVARGFKHMYLATLPKGVILPCLTTLIALALAVVRRNSYVFIYVYAATALITALGLYSLVCRIPRYAKARKTKPEYEVRIWFGTSLPIMLSVGLNKFIQRCDIMLLSVFAPASIIGIYAMAARLAQGINIANLAFNRYWAVSMAKHHLNLERKQLQSTVTKTSRFAFLFSLPLTIFLIAFAPDILLFLGKDFVHGYWLMIILLVGNLIRSFFASGITLLQMTNEEKTATRILFRCAFLLLLGYIIFIPAFQAWGTAVVTSLGLAGVGAWAAMACKRNPGCYTGAF